MKHVTILPALSLLLLTACNDIYYAPNTPHMPMVKDKGITELNMSLGSGMEVGYFDLNAFHSTGNHVGVMVNYSSFVNAYEENNNQHAIDAGAGYFTGIGNKGGFEIYSTLGYGSLELANSSLSSPSDNPGTNLSCMRFSIQPDIFYSSRHFELGFGVRMQYLSHENYLEGTVDSETDVHNGGKNHMMLEPTLKLTVGGKGLKFTLQSTYCGLISGKSFNFDPWNTSIGLALKIFSRNK